MADLTLPRLEDLDRNAEDYVLRLDAGLEELDNLYGSEEQQLRVLAFASHDAMVSRLRCIEGVFVDDFPEETLLKKVGSTGEVTLSRERKTKIRVSDVRTGRLVENITVEERRAYEDRVREVEDRLLQIERVGEDFGVAIRELTEVMALKDPVYTHGSTLHFYLIGGMSDDVYEAHFLMGGSVGEADSEELSSPRRSVRLKPEDFRDEEFLRGFGERVGDYGNTSVYLVINPSRYVSTNLLVAQGVDHYCEYLRGELERAKKSKAECPKGSALLSSLREGICRLKRPR